MKQEDSNGTVRIFSARACAAHLEKKKSLILLCEAREQFGRPIATRFPEIYPAPAAGDGIYR